MGKLLCIVLILVGLSGIKHQHYRRVSGVVIAKEDMQPFPGVSIKIAGTEIVTQTDANGKYIVDLPGENDTLIFKFVGYQTQMIKVDKSNIVNVILAQPYVMTISEMDGFRYHAITGHVIDKNGKALAAVNVSVIGTAYTATTDKEGRYRILVPVYSKYLAYSFIGYRDKKIEVSKNDTINVSLNRLR